MSVFFKNILLKKQNITIHKNLSYSKIKDIEEEDNFGIFSKNRAYCINTGYFTGRSPKDKWIVCDKVSNKTINWGDINQPMSIDIFKYLLKLVEKYYDSLNTIYVYDGFCGTSLKNRKSIRFITKHIWQHHFIKNMFIEPTQEELNIFKPDFVYINACDIVNTKYKKHLLNSENFVALNIKDKIGIIGGTKYTGEIKKGIFSLMHYWLPLNENVLTMHCSANIGKDNDTAIFFGLSGTGKTTLSADPNRFLIGDDEHGWNEDGVFNLEGGCYAKTLNLCKFKEPDIYNAIRENSLLENTYINSNTLIPDYKNDSITQNGRVSYPLEHIPNHVNERISPHPKNIIFLTCDALGVLPIISKLTKEQIKYYFISGYTSKVSGTELNIIEPIATFSACFGEAFLTLKPERYANLLIEKVNKYNIDVYLVNTGWVNGPYGIGKRINISTSRQCISAIIDNSIKKYGFMKDDIFDLNIPINVDGINQLLLNPINTWNDKTEYISQANRLKKLFENNIVKYI